MAMKFRKGLHLASVLTTTFTILTAGRHLRGQPPAPRVVQVFPLQFQAEIPRDVTALIEFNEPLHSLCDPPRLFRQGMTGNAELNWSRSTPTNCGGTRLERVVAHHALAPGLFPAAECSHRSGCQLLLAAADGRLLEYYQTTYPRSGSAPIMRHRVGADHLATPRVTWSSHSIRSPAAQP
ncbi:MAG: hypothetical protein U1G07_21050 [Verrucomicrobiota bacterium]